MTTVQATWTDLAARFLAYEGRNASDMAESVLINPASVYTDPAHYEREFEMIFRRTPLCVALSGDLRNAGDFVTAEVGGVSVLVVRTKDGELKGYVNACRHRGTRLADRSGHLTNAIRCPYHSWTYGFDGMLKAAPNSVDGFSELALDEVSLLSLPVWEAYGLVFVTGTAEASDLAHIHDLALLEDDFASLGMEEFSFFREEVSDWDFNWKFAMDAFLETYHVFSLHRRSVADSFFATPLLFDDMRSNLRMCNWRKHDLQTLDQLSTNENFRLNANLFYIIFPNVIINLPVTGHAELWQMIPLGPEKVRVSFRFYVPSVIDSEKAMKFWHKNFELTRDVVLVEDFPLQKTVHDSLMRGGLTELIYGKNEPGLIHYHQVLAGRLGTDFG